MKIKALTKILFTFAFSLCLFKPLTADAATTTYTYTDVINGKNCIFDAVTYASENPDVVAVIGSDPTALLNHYITTGHLEGRKGYTFCQLHDYDDDGAHEFWDYSPYNNHHLRILEFINTHFTDDMTDVQKIQIIHDYLLDKEHIEDINAGNYTLINRSGERHDEVACNLFAGCMDALGITNRYVRDDTDCEKAHKWVQVLLNGEIYNVDLTWDIEETDPHRFFLYKDSEAAQKGHKPVVKESIWSINGSRGIPHTE